MKRKAKAQAGLEAVRQLRDARSDPAGHRFSDPCDWKKTAKAVISDYEESITTMIRLRIALVSLCLLASCPAATHTVNTTRDENNDPTPALSLREAIGLAEDSDTICFDASLSGAELRLDNSILINVSITIDASSLDCPVAISGDLETHIFATDSGADSVTLRGLILQRGTGSTTQGAAFQLQDNNSLTLEDCIVRHHSGSAIRTGSDVTLTITRCEFYGNNAHLGDGDDFGSQDGGAIWTDDSATVAIDASSFYHNSAEDGGAGYFEGDLTITNSTFAENVSTGFSSAAIDLGGIASASISHCSLVGNLGGAIEGASGGSSTAISHTLLANNFEAGGDTYNGRRYESLGHNLTDISDSLLDDPTDLINTDPQLSALGYHGGAGLSYLPLVGSPLIDGGADPAPPGTPSSDSRGLDRQSDGDDDNIAQLDIGAIEVGEPTMVTNANASGAGSFLNTMIQSGVTRIVFDPSLSGNTITPNSAAMLNSGHIDIDASNLPGGINLTGSGNRLLLLTGDATASMHRIAVSGVQNTGRSDLFNLSSSAGLGLNRCLFFANQSATDLIVAFGCARLHIAGSEFFQNSPSPGSGGGTLIRAIDQSLVQFQKSSLVDNSIDNGSLIISGDDATLEVRNSTFARNTCPDDGAVVDFSSAVPSALTFSTFQANTIDGEGAAVRANSVVKIEKCLFSCNQTGSGVRTGPDIFVPTSSQDPESVISNVTDQALAGVLLDDDSNTSEAELWLTPLANHAGVARTIQFFRSSPFLLNQGNRFLLRAVDAHERNANNGSSFDYSAPGAFGSGRGTVAVQNTDDAGADSLREEIELAPPGAVVAFSSPIETLIELQSPIIIDKNLTIDATSHFGMTISGMGTNRIFDIMPGANVAIYGLTLKDGVATGQNGGGIRTGGNLSLSNCAIVDCSANFGGGLWGGQGAFTSIVIDNCTFTGNSSTFSGNAIGCNQGRIRLTHSTIHDNDGLNGGGFNFLGSAHTAGIYLAGGVSSLQFGHIVLTDNDTRPANGGGLRNGAAQLGAQFTSLGFNLSDGPAGPFNLASDIALSDPMLGSREEVAVSLTLPPLPGSPLIDSGDPDLIACTDRDQRTGRRVADGRIDIGAHETNPNAQLPQLTIDRLFSNAARLEVSGEPGVLIRIESSGDLINFVEEDTFMTLSRAQNFSYLFPGGSTDRRFYRAVFP